MEKKHSEAVYAENFVLHKPLEHIEAKIAGMADDGYTVEFGENLYEDKLFLVSGFAKRYQIEGEIEILENSAIAVHYSKVLNLLPKKYPWNIRNFVMIFLLGIALLITYMQFTGGLGVICLPRPPQLWNTTTGTYHYDSQYRAWLDWHCFQALPEYSRWLIMNMMWGMLIIGSYIINFHEPNKKENDFALQAIDGLEKRFVARLHES